MPTHTLLDTLATTTTPQCPTVATVDWDTVLLTTIHHPTAHTATADLATTDLDTMVDTMVDTMDLDTVTLSTTTNSHRVLPNVLS